MPAMPRNLQHQSLLRSPPLVSSSYYSGPVPIENESSSLQITLVVAYRQSNFVNTLISYIIISHEERGYFQIVLMLF
jgi:hypothetical protein